jgi:hypothetical protein
MAGSTEMLAAFRELTTAKQLERSDLLELLRDGIHAALVRKFGPNVRFELSVDELQGTIKVVRLRQVVETVEDSSWQIPLEEAQYEDPDFQVGDMGASPFRRPNSGSSSACARASAPEYARSSPPRWGSCFRAKFSKSSVASWSLC